MSLLSGSAVSFFACATLVASTAPALAIDQGAPSRPTASSTLTAVSCAITGTGRFTDAADSDQGLTGLAQRDVDVTAMAEGSCLDLRLNKSATGGRAVVRRSVQVTGRLDNATCLVASGHYNATVTWTLDDSTTVTSKNTIDVTAGNFFEQVPGSGTITSGLFSGAAVENNTVYTTLRENTAACGTTAGLQDYTFATQVNVLQ